MFYQEKCFFPQPRRVCVIQNMVSFTSQVLTHFASTLRTSSVKQAGSCQLEQATFRGKQNLKPYSVGNVERNTFSHSPF